MKPIIIIGVLCVFMFCLVCPATILASEVEDNLTYQGNKARVAIGNIKSKADDCSYDMAAAIGEMLSTALVNTGKFIVLASQEETSELIDEIDFGESGYTEEGRSPEKGLMEGADLLVTGAVTTFEPDAGGGGGGLGGLKKKAFGKVGLKTKTAKIAFELKLIDIRTRRILKAKTIKAESKHWKADMTGGGWTEDIALAGGLGVYSNEPMEEAIRAVLAKTVERVSKEVPKEYYRYQGKGEYSKEYDSQSSGQAGGQGTTASSSTPVSSQASTSGPFIPATEDMSLYTKYDFIPGDKVIFYDDMKGEEEGEFPYRWKFERGVLEVARMGKNNWILCTDDGFIRPNIPDTPLPAKYTVEMDFYSHGKGMGGNYFYIQWLNAEGKKIGEFSTVNRQTWLELNGKRMSDKGLAAEPPKGVHTMRIMATSRTVKCFIDEVRVANVPKVENFNPVGFKVRIYPVTRPGRPALIKGFRYAEGGKSMRDQLEETGKIVTHGILFDVNSFTIKGQSYKTLKNIGRILEDDPDLRLSIEGHTDADGADESNQTLSQKRAQAVCDYLSAKYGVDSGRLEAKGWGEGKPLDSNDSAEGKANNRRVELIQL